VADVLQRADLTEYGILVELRLPLASRRPDVLVTGFEPRQGDSAVIVELKQWISVGLSPSPGASPWPPAGVSATACTRRQVPSYHRYLLNTHPAVTDGGVGLAACAYLHRAEFDSTSPTWDASVGPIIDTHPDFAGRPDRCPRQLPGRPRRWARQGTDSGPTGQRRLPAVRAPAGHVTRIIRQEPSFVPSGKCVHFLALPFPAPV